MFAPFGGRVDFDLTLSALLPLLILSPRCLAQVFLVFDRVYFQAEGLHVGGSSLLILACKAFGLVGGTQVERVEGSFLESRIFHDFAVHQSWMRLLQFVRGLREDARVHDFAELVVPQIVLFERDQHLPLALLRRRRFKFGFEIVVLLVGTPGEHYLLV